MQASRCNVDGDMHVPGTCTRCLAAGGLQADIIHERDLGKPPFVPSRSVVIDVNVNLTTTAIYDSPLTSTTPQTSPYTPLGVLHPLTRPTLTQKREKTPSQLL